MSEEEKLLFERIKAFESLIKPTELSKIPHIVLAFSDNLKTVICGSTPQFENPLLRIQILLGVIKNEVDKLEEQRNQSVDEALLMNLFKGKVPVA